MSRAIYEEIKSELICYEEKSCCEYAFISGAIRGAGELNFTMKGFSLTFRHTEQGLMDKIRDMVNRLYLENLTTEKTYIDMGYAKGDFYTLSIPVEIAAELLEKCGVVRNRCELIDVLPTELTGRICCKKAYLRGLFLSCGYLAVPEEISDWHGGKTKSGYSLEFNLNSDIVIKSVIRLIIKAAKLEEKSVLTRKKGSVVYIKNAEAIVAVLTAMGSAVGVLKFHEIMAERQMKNDVNRANNFDLANIDKALSASEKQISDIEKLDREIGIDNLPFALAETCRMRLAYPDAGLAELGSKFTPPIGKSCINHRMRKLAAMANESSES